MIPGSALARSSHSSLGGLKPCIIGMKSPRSAPAQKASSPVPVRIAQRTSGSSLTSCQASESRQSISAFIALRTCGRFIRTRATPSFFS